MVRPPQTCRKPYPTKERLPMEIKANLDAVLVGRILAAVVIIFSFAYSIKAATAG